MLELLLAQLGGISRVSVLLEHGISRHYLAVGLKSGLLIRPRKGWIALPHADPWLLHAAKYGLVLSCVTQAKRLGLWVKVPKHNHFAVPRPGSELRPPKSLLHFHQPVVPRERFALVDEIENVLNLVVACLPFEDAVAIWDSALNKKLVARQVLERLPLTLQARAVLAAADQFADSGLESIVRVRLAWLRVRIIPQAWVLGHRVDFLLGDRLILQIDGGHHVDAQRRSDIRHDAELRLRGYTVIRVDYVQVMNDWPSVQHLITRAIAQGLHHKL